MSNIVTTSSAYDIQIISIKVESERLPASYEISLSVAEVNIFEHLDLPYLTCSIMLLDSANIQTNIRFIGSEKVTIRLKIRGDDTSREISKMFYVTSIERISPTGDTSEALTLNLVEDSMFISNMTSLQKSFSGKPEEIITKICKDYFNKEVSVFQNFETSIFQLRYISANNHPMDVIRLMRDKMYTANKLPYYVFSTLNSDKLFMLDIEAINTIEPLNVDRPYTYGQAFTRYTTLLPVFEQARVIEQYSVSKSADVLNQTAVGAYNNDYDFVDTLRGSYSSENSIRITLKDVQDHLKQIGIIRETDYDDKFLLNDQKIFEMNSNTLSKISTSSTFDNYINIHEYANSEEYKRQYMARAIRWILTKNVVQFSMPGYEFLGRRELGTIGARINVQILKNDPDIVFGSEEALDKQKSGPYIIYTMRHLIKPEKYSVTFTGVKL